MNEFEIISRLTREAPRKSGVLVTGIGDDCAVASFARDRDVLITTDALIEGVHFEREWTDGRTLGRKALAVNLSDIAAMGGEPRLFFVSMGLRRDFDLSYIDALYSGMNEMAARFGAVMSGGDTVLSPDRIFLSITVVGDVPEGAAIRRSGARSGDLIYVSGKIGSSALGLIALQRRAEGQALERYVECHLDPTPRVELGRWLRETGLVTSMIDISDGLISDLRHVVDESGVGYAIDAGLVPAEEGFIDAARDLGCDPYEIMLAGGEDYELLFTVKSEAQGKFEQMIRNSPCGVQLCKIGEIVGDSSVRGVFLDGKRLQLRKTGFDHFDE
jgi:thiamine-monophosphate kinase